MPEDGDGSEELGGCPVLELIENMSAKLCPQRFAKSAPQIRDRLIT
jgi:hypothetical protein